MWGDWSVYAGVLRVQCKVTRGSATLYITCSHGVATVGDKIFAVLGEDRILYTPISSEIGKEYATWVLRGMAWNVKVVRIGVVGESFRYTIPRSFARTLGIEKGDLILAVSTSPDTLEVIPLRLILEKIGKFREPIQTFY